MFSALSCYILVLPHVLYGAGREALALTEEHLDSSVINSSGTVKHRHPDRESNQSIFRKLKDLILTTTTKPDEENVKLMFLDSYGRHQDETPLLCFPNQTLDANCEEDISSGEHSILPLALIFLSQFVLGIGTTLCHTLGKTYLDDSIKKTNAPLMFDNVTQVSSTRCQANLTQHVARPFPQHKPSNYFRSTLYNIEMLGTVMSLRMVGPAIGFALTSFCLRLYIEPTLTPVITPSDPRWLGAWLARRIPKKVKNTQEKECTQEMGVPPKYSPNGVEKSNLGLEIPIKIIENEMMTFKKDKDKNIEKIVPVDDN
ncbi:unnamed protein product, partial [Timema podura]|nr:unnamed protein product [Timema podura]